MAKRAPLDAPVARSPIRPTEPVAVVDGWEVSTRRSGAALRLADWTPMAKLGVRAEPPFAGVAFGRARRDDRGVLTIGSGPDEWLLLFPPGVPVRVLTHGQPFTAVDLTHGRALVRLTGDRAPDLLAKVCAIDLSDRVTPNGTAFRSAVAKLVTDVVRDDLEDGTRSYLLHCERSSGQYLFDALLDAGAEFAIDVDGYALPPPDDRDTTT